MKKTICILTACALLLAGCGGKDDAAAASSAPAEESFTIAEPAPGLRVSLESTAALGRTYVPESPLPREVTDMVAAPEEGIWRAAETADGRAALYGLNEDSVLVEWDGDVVMFDGWLFRTPRAIPPRMVFLPGWGDTLAIVLYSGSGTGVSIETLHLLTKDDAGAVTDHPLPERLYSEELKNCITVNTRAAELTLGSLTLDLAQNREHPLTGEAVLGNIVGYTLSTDGRVQIELGVEALCKDIPPTLNYVGFITADVVFHEDTHTYELERIALGQY